jgi:hypothetical protein
MAIKVRERSENECAVRESAGGRVRLPTLLRRFWAWSAVAFGLMVLVAYVKYRMGEPLLHYNPLGNRRHEDLLEFLPVYRLVHTAAFYAGRSRVSYPPFGAVIYGVIYWTKHPVAFYRSVAAVWLATGVWGVRRELNAHGIGGVTATLFPVTLVLVSFPIAGLLQQGNIELFMWILAAVGTWFFLRGHDDAAAVFWGLAAAVKLFPAILLWMLLPRRRWRAFAAGVATFAAATVLSLAWLGPTMSMAWHCSLVSVFGYQRVRVSELSWHELAANHSVFGLVRVVTLMAGKSPAKLPLLYYACGAVAMGLAFFVRLWKMPVANQLLAVTAFMVMFPPISYFYTLVHLYSPFLVLVFLSIREEREGVKIPGLRRTLMLFVPIFASFTLFTYPAAFVFGGLVQACLLGMLFLCALQYPFSLGETEASAQ